MINYNKQIDFIKNNPQYLLELVQEHQSKVNKKFYEEKEAYYHFKDNNFNTFNFSLGELLVDTYSGLAIDNIYVKHKTDKEKEQSLRNILEKIDFTTNIKDKCLKRACILGTSFIMLAIEQTGEGIGELRALTLSPENTFIRYDEFGRGKWAFRYYYSTDEVGRVTTESKVRIEFIDNQFVTIFEVNGGEVYPIETYLHGFDNLPIVEFSLNEFRSDILSKAMTGTKKCIEILNNADFSLKKALKEYLVAHNIKAPSDKDIAKIMNQILLDRVAVLNDEVRADGSTSQVLNSGIEIVSGSGVTNFTEWLDFCRYIIQIIFMSSNIPNFSSDDFTNPQSGAALKMQLLPANAKIGSTVSFFEKGIRYLLEVIAPFCKIKYGLEYNTDDIEVLITSYEYADVTEIASSLNTLKDTDLFTNETLIQYSGLVEDATAENDRKAAQDKQNAIDYIER